MLRAGGVRGVTGFGEAIGFELCDARDIARAEQLKSAGGGKARECGGRRRQGRQGLFRPAGADPPGVQHSGQFVREGTVSRGGWVIGLKTGFMIEVGALVAMIVRSGSRLQGRGTSGRVDLRCCDRRVGTGVEP